MNGAPSLVSGQFILQLFCRNRPHVLDSDVIFLDLPLHPAIVLGSANAAIDLLDKRSHLYSDRPQSVMVKL